MSEILSCDPDHVLSSSLYDYILNMRRLLVAIVGSILSHCLILYVPFFNQIFSLAPLSWTEWKLVILLSAPVVLVDEVLKAIMRTHARATRGNRKLKAE